MTIRTQTARDIRFAGWGHSPFGKTDLDLESLIVSVVREAMRSARVAADQIDEVVLGQFNSGLSPLAFSSSLVLQADDGLWGVPVTRVENACASGSAAMHAGVRSLLAGTARTVLVVGAEKMTHADAATVGAALLGADYELAGRTSSTGFAGLFARVAVAYDERYGSSRDALAAIASKNHANGVHNPYAHLRRELSVDFCREPSDRNPLVADPLLRTDCSPVSDGAAAVVLTTDPAVVGENSPVRLIGFGQANDHLPAARRDPLAFAGSALAWQRALAMAETSLSELDLIELHDCFTIAELNLYEVLGIAPRGEGARALSEGTVFAGGATPVNVSGGLKSKGHPVGATGVSQHVLAAMQLSGSAGAMQLPSPRRAAVHNMGGLAVANYVSVLEAVD